MKKTFVKVLSALLVTVAFTVLVGCKNNADDGGTAIDQALVGLWLLETDKNSVTPLSVKNVIPSLISFGSNGDVSGNIFISNDGNSWGSNQLPFTGTYTTAGAEVKITPQNYSPLEYTYTISGSKGTFTIGSTSLKYNKL